MHASEVFRVLGVKTRVRIVEILKSGGPMGANRIAEMLGISPAAVSQHLKVLRNAGLVRNERRGYWIPHWIDEQALEECRCMLDEVCACGCREQSRFRKGGVSRMNLAALVRHERELENRLEDVRQRISRMKRVEK